MLSITALPLLALLLLAAATLICSALGRPWPPKPGLWARWVLRLALLMALADTVAILLRLGPGGTLQATIWRIEPRLPMTLSVDAGGTVLAIMVLGAALVVTFAARDRRPLASGALGLAALGAVVATFAGDLLSLYVGLQLATLGGIGLSYARQPRAASSRMVWAAVADQSVGLVWLGVMVGLLHRTATLQLNAIPTGDVSPALAGLLLLPAVVRLAGCGLIAATTLPGRTGSSRRSLDVADWLTVVAVPTALLLFIRVQALSGGVWPEPWFGTCLDVLALIMGAAAVAGALFSSNSQSGLRSALLLLGALVVVGFGQNSANGTVLGLAAGIFLEITVAFLPRALLGSATVPRRPRQKLFHARGGAGWITGVAVALTPCLLGLGVALIGLDLAMAGGLATGIAPALAYLCAVAGLVLTAPRLRRAATSPSIWIWALWLPGLCLVAAALLPGWAIAGAATAIAPPGVTSLSVLSAPDPLVVLAPSFIWPGGYLVLLAGLAGGAGWALRLATGSGRARDERAVPASVPLVVMPERLAAMVSRSGSNHSRTREIRGWYSTLAALADREVGERPIWLWVGATAAAAYVLAEWLKL